MRHVQSAREPGAGGGSVPRRFYNERELAHLLGVSVKTVQHWRLRNRPPAWLKINGAVRYPADSLERFLSECPRGGEVAK